MKQSKYIFSVVCVEKKIRQVSENEEDERDTNESMLIINEGVGIVEKKEIGRGRNIHGSESSVV